MESNLTMVSSGIVGPLVLSRTQWVSINVVQDASVNAATCAPCSQTVVVVVLQQSVSRGTSCSDSQPSMQMHASPTGGRGKKETERDRGLRETHRISVSHHAQPAFAPDNSITHIIVVALRVPVLLRGQLNIER